VLPRLTSLASRQALSPTALQQAARQLGCTVGQLVEGIWAAQGQTTAGMAAGKVGATASRARTVYSAVRALQVAGALTPEIMASGGAAAGTGGILGAIGAAMAGVSTAALVTVASGVVLVGLGAGYIYSRGESPVQPGEQFGKQHGQQAGLRSRTGQGQGSEKYAIVVADISGGSVMIGQESELEATEACRVEGGGLCEKPAGENPLLQYRVISTHDTYDDAVTAWCGALAKAKTVRIPVARDSKAELYGGSYWIGAAPECP
jgi:hypothetical protein